MHKETPIFALDIGTRSVIGTILYPMSDGNFEVKEIKILEHKDRSMLDGQIHDVIAVSETIKQVKLQLEATGGSLKKVAVAAAGRALKTKRVKLDLSIEGQPILRKEDIRALELSAVQEAQKQLIKDSTSEDMTNYHCVGYSVVNYLLDDNIIGNLIDQRGKKASLEIIATFLPRVVVDSLISSLTRAGLEMEALTLEPIAAIHVLIPPSMRKLNIAFVDIGAGTSDIAITDEGTVVAYGMVPVAGDEITEAISQVYLLDFHIAEEIKRKLFSDEEVSFTDILGKKYTIKSSDVINEIESAIEHLADKIAKKILELNKRSTKAVMLVGGGSQTPKLTEKIAEILHLSEDRVAVRGADAIQQRVKWPTDSNKGPELVTPIGIGISSKENPIQYLTFHVNGEIIHLFEMKALTVGDALIAAGIPVKTLFGKPGMAMTVTINNRIKIIPGEHGTLPEILVNKESATIDTTISNGDTIQINPGKNGKDATLSVEEALNIANITTYNLTIDDKEIELMPLVEINGVDTSYSAKVKDRDSLTFYHVKTVEEALILSGYSTIPFTEQKIKIDIMGENKIIKYKPRQLYCNNTPIELNEAIKNEDVISFSKEENPYPIINDITNETNYPNQQIKILFNGKPVHIEPASFQILMNSQKASLDTPIEPNCKIEITFNENEGLKFSDVFRYVDFDRTNPTGTSRYVIKINGEPADFNSPIKQGDQLELYWE